MFTAGVPTRSTSLTSRPLTLAMHVRRKLMGHLDAHIPIALRISLLGCQLLSLHQKNWDLEKLRCSIRCPNIGWTVTLNPVIREGFSRVLFSKNTVLQIALSTFLDWARAVMACQGTDLKGDVTNSIIFHDSVGSFVVVACYTDFL